MVGDVGAVNLLAHVFLCHTERINALWPWDTRGGSSANKTSLPAGHIRSEESGNDKSHSPTFIQTCSSSTQWNQTIVWNRRFFPSVHSERTFRDAGWLASESVQTGLSISNAQMGLMAAGGGGQMGRQEVNLTLPDWETERRGGYFWWQHTEIGARSNNSRYNRANRISRNYLCEPDMHQGWCRNTGSVDTDWGIHSLCAPKAL